MSVLGNSALVMGAGFCYFPAIQNLLFWTENRFLAAIGNVRIGSGLFSSLLPREFRSDGWNRLCFAWRVALKWVEGFDCAAWLGTLSCPKIAMICV